MSDREAACAAGPTPGVDMQSDFTVEAEQTTPLAIIERQAQEITTLLQAMVVSLAGQLQESEAFRAAQRTLEVAQEQHMQALQVQLQTVQHVVQSVGRTRVYRILRWLGRWRFMKQMHFQLPCDASWCKSVQHILPPQPLATCTATINACNTAQPNKEFLDSIRAYNHSMIDEMNRIHPLRRCMLLDIGASPHAYTLERALEQGVTLYAGIGLDIASPQCVLGVPGNVGLLLHMDAASLRFPDDMFDTIVSCSTFEHIQNVQAVLAEMARVLKPNGLALVSFEPIWSCSYGHHLHHFGAWTELVPPWAHLLWTPQQMHEALAEDYPVEAPLLLEQLIDWVYTGNAINRLNIRQFRDILHACPL